MIIVYRYVGSQLIMESAGTTKQIKVYPQHNLWKMFKIPYTDFKKKINKYILLTRYQTGTVYGWRTWCSAEKKL